MSQSSRSVTSFFAIAVFATLAGCSKTAEEPAPAAAAPPAAAEAPPAAKQDSGTFKIGELSALALRDGELELPNDNKVFGVGRTPAEVAAVLSAAGQPTDKLKLEIHPLLVKTADRVLLFDTGAGNNFGPGAGKLSALFGGSGRRPEKRHGHFHLAFSRRSRGRAGERRRQAGFPERHDSSVEARVDLHVRTRSLQGDCAGARSQGRRVRARRRAGARCRVGGGNQGPHAGSFGLPDHVGIRLTALCRRLDAPLHRFRAEAGVDLAASMATRALRRPAAPL